MTSYTRQSSFSDGDTITAALFNNEYNQILGAFAYASSGTTGHRHDGTAGEGGNIHTIGDQNFLNKIVVDSTNNRWGIFVEVSSSAVEQIRVQDGAIVPVTDNDIDLGTSSLEFKDGYFDGTVYADAINFNGTAITATAAELNIMDGVTSTAAELNILDGVTASAADINLIDGITNGTVIASKAIITDSNKDISGGRNITISGELDAATLDISGDADIDGTTNLDEVDIDGVVQIDGATTFGVDDTGVDVKFFGATSGAYLLWDESADKLLTAGATTIDIVKDKLLIGSTAVTTTAAELNILDGVTSTTAELNILDGVTATSAEINLIDGDTIRGTTAVASGDGILINDAGTMRMTNVDTVSTYFSSHSVGGSNIVTTGALNSGSIASGFGAIDNGSSAITTTGTVTFGSLSDGTITATAFVDEDDMSSDSATLIPTQQSVKAYVDGQDFAATSFVMEDGDGTEVTITKNKEMKFVEGGGIDINWTDIDNGTDGDPYDLTFTINAAQTDITSIYATDLIIGEDAQTAIDFGTANEIDFKVDNAARLTLTSGALYPVTNNQIDLGTSSLEFKDAYFDGTVTADAFAGPLTGDVTGNVSGTAATVTGAAQSNITSLGTLTALTVDNVVINNATIGHTDDTDLMTVANGVLTVAGEVSMTTLDIGGANVTSTAAELNILDGVTSTTAELNILDGVTATTTELNYLDITTLGTTQASKAVTTDSNGDVVFPDGDKINLGTGSDLVLQHDSANSYIQNNTGSLNIQGKSGENGIVLVPDGAVTLYHDNAAKLATASGGVAITGDATFADNGKAIFGAGSDLQLYHDGSDSYVDDAGTGILFLRGNSAVKIRKYTGEAILDGNADGSVVLYYDNAAKLATTATGADITGAVTASTFEPDGDTAAGDNAAIGYTSAEGLILTGQGSTSDVTIKNDADQTVLSIPTGTTNVGIGTTSPSKELELGALDVFRMQTGSVTMDCTPTAGGTDSFVWNTSANAIYRWDMNGTERMRIAADGKVGIGTTNPGAMLQVHSAALGTTAGDTQDILQLHSPDTSNNTVYKFLNYRHSNGSSHDQSELRWQRKVDVTNHGYIGLRNEAITFGYGNNERMRIDASGNLLVGTTNTSLGIGNTNTGFQVESSGTFLASRADNVAGSLNRNNDGTILTVRRSGNEVGTIGVTSSATSYNTSSDYRLKENVNYTFDATTRLKQLKPARFNFISDADNTVDGFIAHEVQEVVPHAVTGVKDGEEMQSIDHSKLVPLLTASLQEALKRIDSLEEQVNALKGK